MRDTSQTLPAELLIVQLLEWVAARPRCYADVMEAWRTSCPRLPVWEEADARGFIARPHEPGRGRLVAVTPSGANHLRTHRPQGAASP